jgi:hypothetical protein
MRKIILLFGLLVVFASCEKPSDCVKSAGALTSKQYEYDESGFNTIIVNKGIALVITEGQDYKVEVRTGENLINDITVNVNEGVLTLEDQTTCNWVRDYGQTVVFVTAPNLTDIYAKTELNITSSGILHYPNLRVVSMDSYDSYNGTGTGDFYLNIDNASLTVENNNVSRFYVSGQTQDLHLFFYESGGIFYGQEFSAQHIDLYHRGSNDLYVRPIGSISGDIFNIGNVYSVTHPPDQNVHVVEHYQGKLFFLQ